MTICERLFATLDEKGLKAAGLCRTLGIGTNITTGWKQRNTDPPAKFIAPICEYLGCSLEYLLTGRETEKAPVLEISENRREMLELYGRLLAGEASVIAEINHQWQGRLAEIAGEYTAEKAWREELVQEGNVGLLVGLDRLLGKEGEEAALVEMKLESYVRESMEEFCQKEESTEYQEKLLLAKVNFIHEAQKQLAEENFAIPTVQELADFTRMPEEEVMAILSLSRERN